jgi:hypothetical protein
VRPIPDSLLLTTAQTAARLIGPLMVAVFFSLEDDQLRDCLEERCA